MRMFDTHTRQVGLCSTQDITGLSFLPTALFARIAFLSLVCCLVGCSVFSGTGSGDGRAVRITDVRSHRSAIKTIQKSISKEDYLQRLREGGALNRVRLVEVFHRGGQNPYPFPSPVVSTLLN